MSKFIYPSFEPGLVSVIIPTYNRAHFLRETIQSVFEQTYQNFEIFVIDDGSTDNTEEVVSKIKSENPNHKLEYYYSKNRGASAARNIGLAKANGEYIQHLDSDDLLLSCKIQSQIEYLKNNLDIEAVYSYSRSFNENNRNRLRARIYHDPKDQLEFVLRPWVILFHPESALWRRSAAIRIGPCDEQVTHGEDMDYWVRFLVSGKKFGCTRQVHSHYRMHKARMSNRAIGQKDAESSTYLCRKLFTLFSSYNNGSYLPAVSERIWRRWTFLVKCGFQMEQEALLQLLREIDTKGKLSRFVKLAIQSANNPNTKKSLLFMRHYRHWRLLNRLRGIRFPK